MLDGTDLRMAVVAVRYYLRAHELVGKPPSPAAYRLAVNLNTALSADGRECVVPQADWLTTREVAERLRCSDRHARRIAQRVGRRVGRQWLINPDALPEEP